MKIDKRIDNYMKIKVLKYKNENFLITETDILFDIKKVLHYCRY